MIALLFELFTTFFLIGLFTFGGGYAMLTLIQDQVVVQHAWITHSQFTDIVAISQMTPGPIGINSATFIGYEVGGVLGSFTATFAIVLPSFIVMLAMVKAYDRIKDSRIFKNTMQGLRPAVIGMIGAAAVILILHIQWNGFTPEISIIRETFPDWKSWILFAGAYCLAMWTKLSPILLIVIAGFLGFLLY